MSYRIIRPATHEEWLEERKKGIGSSDAGTIMGASPFMTPYRLFLQKTGQSAPVQESDAMFNGHILEPAVAEWFAARTGSIIDITSEGDWLAVDTERDYLRVSPDRLYWPKGTPARDQTPEHARVLEIKSTSKAVDKDDLPDYWYCQIQYQMGILGITEGALCWITGTPTLHFDYVTVPFNRPFYETLIAGIDRFWNGCILTNVPPADTDAEDTLARFPVAETGTEASADESTFAMWKSLKDCRGRLKELEEREANLTDALKRATGGCETLTYTDRETGEVKTLATWKNSSRSILDEAALRRERPDLWERYSLQQEAAFDGKALRKAEPEVYKKFTVKMASTRKFQVK